MHLCAWTCRRFLAASAVVTCAFAPGASASAATLTVDVGNVAEAKGQLRIAVYDEETWLDTERWIAAQRVPAATEGVSATFELPSGTYAVAVLHDLNENEKMDYRLLRLPKEPYGFSNGVVPRLGPPAFEDARFIVADEPVRIRIELRN